jgi:phosphoglucosamine mutase
VDCANGAACRVAPLLLARLGITPHTLNAEPNGRNINLHCGSLHPETMAEATLASGADLGVAFDGDADRAIFATHEGRLADGDHVLSAVAPFLERQGSLKGRAVVGTLMTNLALEQALARQGIGLKRTDVGDKYVLEEMLRSGISLGGEPSGHIIFSDLSLAGDGMITLLEVLRLLAETDQPFHHLLRGYQPFPQLIRNVRVREKPPLESIPSVAQAITEASTELGERGRVVVRYSGTEPLARVMVEGAEAQAVKDHTARIAAAIESALGSGH